MIASHAMDGLAERVHACTENLTSEASGRHVVHGLCGPVSTKATRRDGQKQNTHTNVKREIPPKLEVFYFPYAVSGR